jgi:4'-phosphopantetheinyl transferase
LSLDENRAGGNAVDAALSHVMPLASPVPGIGLWWCELDVSAARLETSESYLSDVERARAARFGRRELRDRYVVGRASLRAILGRTLGIAPAEVPIVRGVRGRPQLAGDASLDFNVSHTGGVAIVGTLRNARIGVDVEQIDRTINVAGISLKFLSDNERRAIAPLDADAARRTVLTLWTCKEAMSKATGDALAAPFPSLDVDLRGGPTLRDGPGEYRPRRWSLYVAAVPSDHVATVAVWRPS